MINTVVVTGASGYIGGEVALKLKDAGYTVVGIDLRLCPANLADSFDLFVQGDFSDDDSIDVVLNCDPVAVIHCAGTSLVGPSVTNPELYYNNNVVKTLHFLDQIKPLYSKTRFIFSSSASVYGTPIMVPCNEVDPCEPISPYGESKRMIEQVLASYHTAYNLDYVAFRYFNACGADSQARHGQEPGATHIIARILESIKQDTQFVCNGSDYDTPDHTCVRDYIHVEDIADAHILALHQSIAAGVYNIGTSSGISNLEVIQAASEVTDRKFTVQYGPRREGDPAILTADPAKFQSVSSWKPKYNLKDMISHAWNWYNR